MPVAYGWVWADPGRNVRSRASPARRTCGNAEPTRRAGFAANEGSAKLEAAFRIEPGAPTLALSAARLRSERAVGTKRERPGGHAVSARLPCTFKGLRRRCSRFSPRRLPRSVSPGVRLAEIMLIMPVC